MITKRRSLRLFLSFLVACLLLLAYTDPRSFSRFDLSTASQVHWDAHQRPLYPHIRQMHDDPSLLRTVIHTEAEDRLPHANLTLVLTLTNDTLSWGRMNAGRKYKFNDFIKRIRGQGLPSESVHIGLLTSDKDAYAAYVDQLASASNLPFARADVIYVPSLPADPSPTRSTGRAGRHRKNNGFQNQRRRQLARFRNFLSNEVLMPAVKHVIWLDADVYELPKGLFARFIDLASIPVSQNISNIVHHVDTSGGKRAAPSPSATATNRPPAKTTSRIGTPNKKTGGGKKRRASAGSSSAASSTPRDPLPIGLLTLRCMTGRYHDYDRNSWAGFGPRPKNVELEGMLKGKKFPGMEKWAKALSQLTEGTKDNELVHLDAVGGTALYIRADLLREGLSFPAYSVSGTQWGRDGKDGVETEGLCYIAERMGYGCYGLGGNWRTVHSDG
ncbi:hypothetical protein ABW21_db0208087 [Orbilia brochopaga]|nr:hypothetical protein ABW21_db0208087 [Drechslerella brochopaga]